MRASAPNYVLRENDVAAFRHLLERELSISDLARGLGRSKALATQVAKRLQEKGFVEVRRHGMTKIASIASTRHAQLLADLIKKEPYIPWERVLAYSTLHVLMEHLMRHQLGREVSMITRWRVFRNLAAHGLLPAPEEAKNAGLVRFVEAYADYVSRRFSSKVLPRSAVVLWMKGFEFLFRVPSGTELPSVFQPTALTVFPRYGVSLVTNYDYYFYSPHDRRGLGIEDVLVHTLLIDTTSVTYVTYALLLLFKMGKEVNRQKLLMRGEEYGISDFCSSLLKYLDTEGKERLWPLPEWESLKEKAELYGVKMS